jgi:hypothetical protein
MFTHNLVVRHANGEYEGFSGCGSNASAAERNAKAKAARDIDAKRLDPARVSYLTKREFDDLDDGTKAMIRRDWRLDARRGGLEEPEGEFKGVPNDWGVRSSAYSRISRIAAPDRIETKHLALGEARHAELLAAAKPQLDMRGEPTGWMSVDFDSGRALLHPAEPRAVQFRATDQASGSDLLRAKAMAQAYAMDHPVAEAARGPRGPSAHARTPRTAAPRAKSRYEWGGELLTKAQMLSKAVAKEVVFMGNEDAPTFHAVMDEPEGELHGDERGDMKAGVFPITQAEFDRLRAEDATTPRARERYLAFRVKELSGKLPMRDGVDFNSWARRNDPSMEEKVAYLQRILFGLAAPPAKFTPPDMSRPGP